MDGDESAGVQDVCVGSRRAGAGRLGRCTGGSVMVDMTLPPDMTEVDLKFAGYPPGPYGAEPGDVIQNFVFQGYYSPTNTMGLASSAPFGEVTLDQVRTSGAK